MGNETANDLLKKVRKIEILSLIHISEPTRLS